MKIKNTSGFFANATLHTTLNSTKLVQTVNTTEQKQKPKRQTAAQRRAALAAKNAIIINKEPISEEIKTTATPPPSSPSTVSDSHSIKDHNEQDDDHLSTSSSINTIKSDNTSITDYNDNNNNKLIQLQNNAESIIITPPTSPTVDEASSPLLNNTSLEANTRILAAKRDGNLKSVMMEFSSIKKESLPVTHQTYNLVLDAYSALRREGSPLTPMLKVYDEMRSSHIQPSSYTYTILIRTLCRRDVEVQKTIAMLKRQSARTGYKMEDIDILEMEANLARSLDFFYEAISSQHIQQVFEVDLFNQLLRVLSHYGDTINANKVYTELEKSTNADANAATYAALINLFGRAGDIQAARRYFATYQERKDNMGSHDASYVYNALVDSHLKCGLLDGALRVIEQDMIQDNIKLTIIPYNSIIRHYCTQIQMDKAHQVVQQLLKDPETLPQPDASTYGPILAAYCHTQDMDGANRVYADLIKTDIAKSYGNLANYALLCLAKNHGEKALQVVEDMRIARLEPDPILACRIISYFIDAKNPDQAVIALHTILGVLSPRTLMKGQRLLVDVTLQLINHLKDLHQVLKITQVAVPLLFSGKLPIPIAKVMVKLYQEMNQEVVDQSSSFILSEYNLLFDALMSPSYHLFGFQQNDTKDGMNQPMPLFLSLLKRMEQDGLVPSSTLVSRVANYWQRRGDVKAEATWRNAIDPITTNANTSTTIIIINSKNKNDLQQKLDETKNNNDDNSLLNKNDDDDDDDQQKQQQSNEPINDMTLFDLNTSQEIMKSVMQSQLNNTIDLLNIIIQTNNKLPLPDALRDAIALVGKQGKMGIALKMYELCLDAYEKMDITKNQFDQKQAIFAITNSVLIGYAQQGDMTNAKIYYDKIKDMSLSPDGNGYASLLLGSAKCATDEASDALIIYDEAKRHNVKPTTFFYNVVISKLAKARKLEPALYLFEEMREFKVSPNSITYGAIISACVRAGSETHALRLFNEMLASPSYQPRVGPFNNMMQFYVRQQPNRERVLEYFAELRRRHIKPSPHTYKLLMEAYASMTPYDMVTSYRLLSEMERRDRIRPQTCHFSTLIYAYGTLQRDVQSADRVFEEMCKLNIKPDESVYQAMLDTLISNDLLERAEDLYQQMLSSIEKSSSPYIENLFIRGYGQKGFIDKAEKIFNNMTDDKTAALIGTATTKDNNYKNNTKKYNKSMVIREPSTYEAMVRAYLENNMIDKAKSVLDQMVQRDFPSKVLNAVVDLVME